MAAPARRPPRADGNGRLRPGDAIPAALGQNQISQIQRARILSAVLEVVAAHGAANVNVSQIVDRSGVSRRTFYETFSDREDCYLAAFEEALALAASRVLPAYDAHKRWSERIRAGLIALLCFLDDLPVIGRVLLVESQSFGARVLERRNELLAQLVAAVAAGREETKTGERLPPLIAEGAVGGVLSILQTLLASPTHDEPLLKLANPLMGMVVLPYLGTSASRRELDRPVEPPAHDGHAGMPLVDPFKPAGLRLTYRTVRVLMAVAEHAGASNREIGDLAEIRDQGQISKLLNRLKRAGLIDSGGIGPGQGAPNAWTQTATGRQMTDSIRTHTAD
jgi:AcrR family transcriptional regulator